MKISIGMNEQDDKPEAAEPKKYHDHEISSAADTLMRAEEIKKKPDLMVHVKKHLDEKAGHIKSIKGLKAKYQEVSAKEAQGSADQGNAEDL